MPVFGGRPRAGIGPKIASGAGKEAYRSPLCLNPAVGTGIGLVRPRCPHQALYMFPLSEKARATYGKGHLGGGRACPSLWGRLRGRLSMPRPARSLGRPRWPAPPG